MQSIDRDDVATEAHNASVAIPMPGGVSVAVASICAAIDAVRPLKDEDILFVGGSVAEGRATPRSDIDAYLITDAPAGEGDARQFDVPFDGPALDVEIWDRSEVDALALRLASAGQAWRDDVRSMSRLTLVERDFLHRLRHGLPVHNPAGFRALIRKIDWDDLAGLTLARALLRVTNAQTDLAGFLEAGDVESAVLVGQTLCHFAASAYLAAHGVTHPGEKWLVVLLRRLEQEVRVPAALTGLGGTLSGRVFMLLSAQMASQDSRAYLRACIDFANLIVPCAQFAMSMRTIADQHGTEHINPLALDVADFDWNRNDVADNRPLPALALTAQLRFARQNWYLLNVADTRMFKLNPVAASFVAKFDGHSPCGVALAQAQLISSAPTVQLRSALADLIRFLAAAGLLQPEG